MRIKRNTVMLFVLLIVCLSILGGVAMADQTLTLKTGTGGTTCFHDPIANTYVLHAVWEHNSCQALVEVVKGAALGYVCSGFNNKPALTHRTCNEVCCCTSYIVPFDTVTVDNTCHNLTSPSIQSGFVCS